MEAIATKGCRRGPHGKFTEAELDGVHLVLCNNAEYLIHRCHWEERYHHEFDSTSYESTSTNGRTQCFAT